MMKCGYWQSCLCLCFCFCESVLMLMFYDLKTHMSLLNVFSSMCCVVLVGIPVTSMDSNSI